MGAEYGIYVLWWVGLLLCFLVTITQTMDETLVYHFHFRFPYVSLHGPVMKVGPSEYDLGFSVDALINGNEGTRTRYRIQVQRTSDKVRTKCVCFNDRPSSPGNTENLNPYNFHHINSYMKICIHSALIRHRLLRRAGATRNQERDAEIANFGV